MAQQPMRIVFLDRETISPQTVLRPASFPHELVVHQRTGSEQVAGRIAQADIVITNKVRLDRAALEQAPNLKMIAVAATGTDVVDMDTCRSRDLVVSHIRGYGVHTVPELTFQLYFNFRRSILAFRASVQAGRGGEQRHTSSLSSP